MIENQLHKTRFKKINSFKTMRGFDLIQLSFVMVFIGMLTSALLIAVPEIKERMIAEQEIKDLIEISENIRHAYDAGHQVNTRTHTNITTLIQLGVFPKAWVTNMGTLKNRFNKPVEIVDAANDSTYSNKYMKFKKYGPRICSKVLQGVLDYYPVIWTPGTIEINQTAEDQRKVKIITDCANNAGEISLWPLKK